MRFKRGVIIKDIKPEIVLALYLIDTEYKAAGVDMWVTSVNDGQHKINSKHYWGLAADIRTKNVPRHQLMHLVESVRELLPTGYDVVLEHLNSPNEHLHIEWDLKAPLNPPSVTPAV